MEGTAQDMLNAMDLMNSLPDSYLVFCGHEYTLANLAFCNTAEPKNQAVQNYYGVAKGELDNGRYSIPSFLADEKKMNVFMRVRDPTLQKAIGIKDPVKAMTC